MIKLSLYFINRSNISWYSGFSKGLHRLFRPERGLIGEGDSGDSGALKDNSWYVTLASPKLNSLNVK